MELSDLPQRAEPRHSRRWVPVLAAAATVVGVVTAAPWVADRISSSEVAPAGTSTIPTPVGQQELTPLCYGPRPTAAMVPRLSFTVRPIDGLRFYAPRLCANGHVVHIETTAQDFVGQILVYPRSGFDPAFARQGTPVTINGRPGFLANLASPAAESAYFLCLANGDANCAPARVDDLHPTERQLFPTVSWEFAPDTWAQVRITPSGVPGTRTEAPGTTSWQQRPGDTALRIAESVEAGRPSTLKVPLALDHLPAGLLLEAVDQYEFAFSDGQPARPTVVYPGKQISALAVGAAPFTGPLEATADTDPITVNGFPGRVQKDNTRIGFVKDGFEVWVRVGPGHAYPRAELLRIAEGISTADKPADPSTWIDATEALPR